MNWKPIKIKLRDLKPWDRNPRRISKKRAERLLRSWHEFGQAQTIAVGPNGEVYDGHQRLSVLRAAHGDDYEVIALQSDRALTDDERAKFAVLIHLGATGTWNWDELASWDDKLLIESGFDFETLQDLKQDAAAIKAMVEAQGEFARVDEAEVHDLSEKEPRIVKCPQCGHEFEIDD